jgi:hypothetical protein
VCRNLERRLSESPPTASRASQGGAEARWLTRDGLPRRCRDRYREPPAKPASAPNRRPEQGLANSVMRQIFFRSCENATVGRLLFGRALSGPIMVRSRRKFESGKRRLGGCSTPLRPMHLAGNKHRYSAREIWD